MSHRGVEWEGDLYAISIAWHYRLDLLTLLNLSDTFWGSGGRFSRLG